MEDSVLQHFQSEKMKERRKRCPHSFHRGIRGEDDGCLNPKVPGSHGNGRVTSSHGEAPHRRVIHVYDEIPEEDLL